MKLLHKIHLRLKKGESRRYLFGERTLWQYDIRYDKSGKRSMDVYYPAKRRFGSYSQNKDNRRVFYLKVNRVDYYVLWCIQQWIYVVDLLDADFYFVCDNPKLENKILENIRFRNVNIKFLRSETESLEKYVDLIAIPCWRKACAAHLTTFLHAKENGYKRFWNIDADDTMFLMSPNKTADMLLRAEECAEADKIDILSLDMWYSLSKGRHWSFGVSYVNNEIDWFALLKPDENADWKQKISSDNYNADWYFTYLRNNGRNIQTFYVDNCSFIHWGKFEPHELCSNISNWTAGKLVYPISQCLYDEKFAEREIPEDCIRLDVNTNEIEAQKFINALLFAMAGK